MALAGLVAGAAERNALVEHAVVAHDGGFADDDAHGVVDKEMLADLCGGMNLDAGDVAGDLREHTGERAMTVLPEPVLGHVVPLGVQARIGKEDDQTALCGGVLRLDGLDVLANGIDKAHRPPSLAPWQCDSIKYSDSLGIRKNNLGGFARQVSVMQTCW